MTLSKSQRTALRIIKGASRNGQIDLRYSWSELSYHTQTSRKTAMSLVRLGLLIVEDDLITFKLSEKGREYIQGMNIGKPEVVKE